MGENDQFEAGRRQGWLDVAGRDKSDDGFASGVDAGMKIAESRFAKAFTLAEAKLKRAREALDHLIRLSVNAPVLYDSEYCAKLGDRMTYMQHIARTALAEIDQKGGDPHV